MDEFVICFEARADIGVGRGSVGLEPIFLKMDEMNQSEIEDWIDEEKDITLVSIELESELPRR